MDTAHLFALGLALAWLAGLRVYLTVLALGLTQLAGYAELPPALAVCSSPWVIGVAAVLTVVEFSADKIPGVDSLWDLLHTVLRVPAGAWLAGATLAEPGGELSGMGLLAGGAAALLSHGLKSGGRALINTSPEHASNWAASLGEDAVAVTALLFVVQYPLPTLLVLFSLGLLLATAGVWLLRALHRRLRGASTKPA